MRKTAVTLLLFLLSACSGDVKDPLRPVNEAVFDFNRGTDFYVIKPVAETYHEAPDTVRGGIGNFLTNLQEPAHFVNGVLQLNGETAFVSFWRFFVNTTIGVGGLIDVAGETGLHSREVGFDDTLASYGMPQGPYMVLPLAGPSSLRGTAGLAVDWFIDPLGYFMTTGQTIAQIVGDNLAGRDDQAEHIDRLLYAPDPYEAVRKDFFEDGE